MATKAVLDAFRSLEQHLCEVRFRALHYRQTDECHCPVRGHHAMAGLALGRAHSFLEGARPKLAGVPTKQALAEEANFRKQDDLAKCMQGKPNSRQDWCDICRRLLRWMLLRVYNAAAAEGQRVSALPGEYGGIAARIEQFLFYAPVGERTPLFMHPKRRPYAAPCCHTELGHEFAYFGRQALVDFRASITILLATQDYSEDPMRLVIDQIVQAARCGAAVRWVNPANGVNQHLIDACRAALPADDAAAPVQYLKMSDLPPSPFGGSPYPLGHVIYMDSFPPADNQPGGAPFSRCLFVRHFANGRRHQDHEKLAVEANLSETERVQQWVNSWGAGGNTSASVRSPGPEGPV